MKNNNRAVGVVFVIVFALVYAYWQWILGFIVVGLVGWGVYVAVTTMVRRRRERVARERAANAGLAARADQQHQQYLAGEDHGLYGDYKPARLD